MQSLAYQLLKNRIITKVHVFKQVYFKAAKWMIV